MAGAPGVNIWNHASQNVYVLGGRATMNIDETESDYEVIYDENTAYMDPNDVQLACNSCANQVCLEALRVEMIQ